MIKSNVKLEESVVDDFGPMGTLANTITGFKPRAAQQQMAVAINETIANQRVLVIEAGTGIGKTYAYLVPVLRADKQAIISTGSKALQDQLYQKDLPTILNALEVNKKIALLKGRANYLCLERFDQQVANIEELTPNQRADLARIEPWLAQTDNGDISYSPIAEDNTIWPLLTSNKDNCLGSDCPQYKTCYVIKARRKAMEADVIVINHHLFLADTALKETGFAELIPNAEIMIFDEAHQLPDIASHYFGQQLTSKQLFDLAKDMIVAYHSEVKDTQQLLKSAERLIHCVRDFRLVLGNLTFKGNLRDALLQPIVQQAWRLLHDTLILSHDVIELSAVRSTLLANALERIERYKACFLRLQSTDITGYSYWYEYSAKQFVLALTPLSVANKFQELIANRTASWIFTSATLSVNEQVGYFTERLGLQQAHHMLLASPFDYAKQALLYVPRYLPDPNQRNTAPQLIVQLLPLLNANQGGCFLLCTSHQMMREFSEILRKQIKKKVLMQGEKNKTELLAEFRQQGDAILVATSSFWQGVDVQGNALSCVIIDKLPFTAPEDPLLKARIEDCRLKGIDPFTQIQLPEAVIVLKQGIGRLIRGVDDRGVLVICDNRLVTRSYGNVFLNSLPAIPRTRNRTKVIDFLIDISNLNARLKANNVNDE